MRELLELHRSGELVHWRRDINLISSDIVGTVTQFLGVVTLLRNFRNNSCTNETLLTDFFVLWAAVQLPLWKSVLPHGMGPSSLLAVNLSFTSLQKHSLLVTRPR